MPHSGRNLGWTVLNIERYIEFPDSYNQKASIYKMGIRPGKLTIGWPTDEKLLEYLQTHCLHGSRFKYN